MGILFDITQWQQLLAENETMFLLLVAAISIIAFFISFIKFMKYMIKENEYKGNELGTTIGGFFIGLVVAGLSFVALAMISEVLIVFIIAGLVFIICYGIGKLINYIVNQPPRKVKVEITNIREVAKGVYDEMLKINPNVKYEDIYASIEKKFSK